MTDPLVLRPSSQIQRRSHAGGMVYEKRYVPDDWGGSETVIRRRAKREQDLLAMLRQSDGFGRRLGIVRVAHCDPDNAIIATHEVPGQALEQWLRSSPERGRSMFPWLLAGQWLRAFQRLPLGAETAEQLCQQDPDDLVEYCDLRLRSLQDYGYAWPDRNTRIKLLDKVAGLWQQRSRGDRATVWVHADYAPGNLIWGNGVLTPIDFAMARQGGPLDDATYLIHRLEMQAIYRPWQRLPVAACRRAILRGLGREQASDTPAYRVLMIKHLICRLHTYVRRPARNAKQATHDRWVRMMIRRRLHRLAMTQPRVAQ